MKSITEIKDGEADIFSDTMRDNTASTRYFSFKLPKVNEGQMCEKYDVKKVVLGEDGILQFFDCGYHHYIQGASFHDGKIYSLEGFTDSLDHAQAIRIIDTNLKKEIACIKFKEYGTNIEPEMIDFYHNICYYIDHNGNMYNLFFEF